MVAPLEVFEKFMVVVAQVEIWYGTWHRWKYGGVVWCGVVWSSDNTVSKVQRILDLDQDLGSFLDSDFGF